MKKLTSILLSSALLTTISASNVFAAETGTDYELILNYYYGSVYNVTATNPDGTTYNPLENRNENLPAYLTYINNATEICIDETAYYEEYKNKLFSIGFNTKNREIDIENEFPGQIVINDKELTVKNSSSEPNEKYYDITIASGEIEWAFYGDLDFDNNVKVNFVDNGLILTGDSAVPRKIEMREKIGTDEQGNDIWEYEKAIEVTENVMVSLDENNEIVLSIDPDKDGVYEPVKKGDVNNDGNIDASDASIILDTYSKISIGESTFIYTYAGDYNNDGIINANDATAVLKGYSEVSTNN